MHPLLSILISNSSAIKKGIALIIIGAFLALAFVIHQHIKNLENEKSTLEIRVNALTVNNEILNRNNEVLKQSILSISSTNDVNIQTIKKLVDERKNAQKAINNLAKATASDKKKIDDLQSQIDTMIQDKNNDGDVSPVLRETIRGIQKIRK